MKQIDTAFLTMLVPQQLSQKVERLSQDNMQAAANVLQWNIYDGLCRNLNRPIRLFNILPLGSFPKYYKQPFVGTETFSTENCPDNLNIGFCNIELIRRFSQPARIYRALANWCRTGDGEKFLFVYTIGSSVMLAVSKLKRRFKNLKVCAIVADLPNMSCLSSDLDPIRKRFNAAVAKKSFAGLHNIDYFVLLTEQMADYMKISQPYCVMEGIAQTFASPDSEVFTESKVKTVFYAGTLHKQFGILHLLDAFRGIRSENYRLLLCGTGDSVQEIQTAAREDSRICFLGLLSREEVLKHQRTATVLVNPRQNIGEYVKYSFPSKTLEFLMSGRPLVAYRLAGIPEEYDTYIHYVKDSSAEALREKLVEICEKSDSDEIKDLCLRAKHFVSEEKNAVAQTKIILKMLELQGIDLSL